MRRGATHPTTSRGLTMMNWRRGLFRLWAAASLIWMLLIIAIAIGAKLHPEFRVSDRIKSVPLREAVDREREREEAYKRGPLLEDLKTGYEEAVRRGLVSPSNEAFVVHNETGDILYRPAGADNNWEPIVVAVVRNTREMFGLVSKKWKQISEQGRPGITRRIEDALRDTNDEWVLVNFPGEIGDVMFSPNFEVLSRDERNTAGREFLETLKPPIEIQSRSDLLNQRFWILLLGPPISVGVPMLLIAWIVLGFQQAANCAGHENVQLRRELKNKDQTIDHLQLADRAACDSVAKRCAESERGRVYTSLVGTFR